MKVVLIADGLTFNNELSTWLDPLTYVGVKDGPGVKKYKDMLYDFMSVEGAKIEVFETIDTISELTKNVTDVAKDRADTLIKKLEKCQTVEQLESTLHSLEAKSVFTDMASGADEKKLSFMLNDESGFGQFARSVGLATKALSFVDIIVTDAIDLINFNSRLAVYNEYKDFLKEVSLSTDLPWEMRLAATEISDDLDDGVFGQIRQIAYDLANWSGTSGILEENGLKKVLTKSGYSTFSDLLSAIEITSWAINQVVDIGAISKGATFVEGYAYLSNHFLNKLINDRIAFRTNQTPENAKKFINTYNTLYQLRYKGEEAALKMHKIDGIAALFTDFGYSDKEAAEETILAVLEGCKFEDADGTMLPPSEKYQAKSVISCPVNVEIYDPNGNYITTLYDGVESDITNEHGRFSVVYRSYTDSYAKVICLKNKGNYTIKADGINSGLVNIAMCVDKSGQIESYYAANVTIDTGNSIYLEIDDVVEKNEYGFDKDGDGVIDEQRTIDTNSNSSEPSKPTPDIPSGPVQTTYSVSVTKAENGKVDVDKKTAKASEKVLLTVIPDPGYELEILTVTDVQGNVIQTTANRDGTYSFTMPQSSVTIKIAFKLKSCDGGAACPAQNYTDVSYPSWYHEGVDYAITNKLMVGKSKTIFDPNGITTRAEMVTILYRLDGKPTTTNVVKFNDVPGGRWYSDAINWAAANDIVGGYGNGKFGPGDPITREQVAAILYRYAEYKGYDISGQADLTGYTDAKDVSGWALTAMRWANDAGLITGRTAATLAPDGTTNRAEAAAILMRFCQKVAGLE